jgi:hypothetical protein
MKRKAREAFQEPRRRPAISRAGLARVWAALAGAAVLIGSCSGSGPSAVVPTPTFIPAPSSLAAASSPVATASLVSSHLSESPEAPSVTPATVPSSTPVRVLAQTVLPARFVPDSWALDAMGTLWLSQVTDRAGTTGLIAVSSTNGDVDHTYSVPAHGVFAEQGLWVGTGGPIDTTGLARLDPATGKTIAGVTVGGIRAIAAGFGSIWTSDSDNKSLSKIDPATARITVKWSIPGYVDTGCGQLEMIDDSDASNTTIRWIDPTTGAVKSTIKLDQPLSMHPQQVGKECVAITSNNDSTGNGESWVVRLGSDGVISKTPLSFAFQNAVVIGGILYTYGDSGLLTGLDPATGSQLAEALQLPSEVVQGSWLVHVVGDQVWVFSHMEDQGIAATVSRLDLTAQLAAEKPS